MSENDEKGPLNPVLMTWATDMIMDCLDAPDIRETVAESISRWRNILGPSRDLADMILLELRAYIKESRDEYNDN